MRRRRRFGLLEFLIGAGAAREFVIALVAVTIAVAHPTFGNARIVGAAVLTGQAFSFATCGCDF